MFRVSGLSADVSPVAWRGVVCLMAASTADILGSRLRLVDALRSDGWRVVVCSQPDSDVQQLTERGIEHRPMRMSGSRRNLFARLVTYAAVTNTLRRLRPKVVLSWTPSVNAYAALAARSLMLPLIANVSARDGEMLHDRQRPRVLRAVSRMAFGWPTMVFFQHRADQQTFIRDRLVKSYRACQLPALSVDVDRFTPVPREAPHQPCFLMAASPTHGHGLDDFVKAARIVRAVCPNVRFVVDGALSADHPDAVPMETLAAWQHEGIIDCLPDLADKVRAYAQADCVVLPASGECLPHSLLEAGAMGKPSIATDVPGCRDVIVDGVTGLLVAPDDASALAESMMTMLRMPDDQRIAMGEQARERIVAEFDDALIINAYRQMLSMKP
jgi:glycosyltransferase involved in cell wall biosynthesis